MKRFVHPTDSRRGERPRVEWLEALRALAAIAVVLFHAEMLLARLPGGAEWSGIFGGGAAGVDLFFVLSGFIIAVAHSRDIDRPDRYGTYVWNRLSRIYPACWIMTLAALTVYGMGLHGTESNKLAPWSILASFLLLPQAAIPLVNVTWSLVFEIFFYAIFGLAILNARLGLAVVILWQLAAIAAFLLAVDLSSPWLQFLHPQVIEFGIGLVCAWLAVRHHASIGTRLAASIAVIGVAGLLYFVVVSPLQLSTLAMLPALLIGGCAGAAVLGGYILELQGKLRVPKPLAWLGGASYAIYLVHFSVLTVLSVLIGRLPITGMHPLLVTLLAVLVAILAGVGFHLVVDRPLQRYLRASRDRRRGGVMLGKIINPLARPETREG